jgi:hypothetical protein
MVVPTASADPPERVITMRPAEGFVTFRAPRPAVPPTLIADDGNTACEKSKSNVDKISWKEDVALIWELRAIENVNLPRRPTSVLSNEIDAVAKGAGISGTAVKSPEHNVPLALFSELIVNVSMDEEL